MKQIDMPSPNQGPRPEGVEIGLVVLHYTGMQSCKAALDRLIDPLAQVSAHYLIDENGDCYELVPESERAWHAGVSYWQGCDNVNDISVGIELVNPGHEFGYTPFPEAQMQSLMHLLGDIKKRHNIAAHAFVGHSDVAPDRKMDPGEKFDWPRLAKAGFGIMPDKGEKAGKALAIPGIKSDVVMAAQHDLCSIGYKINPTGHYDSATNRAILAFQRHWCPASVTGLLDCGTVAQLAHVRGLMP